MDYLQIDETFPALITPKKNLTYQAFLDELPAYKSQISDLLLKNGALLFRGFPLKTSDDFASFIETLNLGQFVNYIMGDSPRDKVKNKVYTSTEAPPAIHIPLHQELSYVKSYPKNIYFFCEIEPQFHGETIIANARRVYKALDPAVINRFEEKKITYISHYHYKDALMSLVNRIARSHKSWVEVFETDDKTVVEDICKKNEIEFDWLPKDWIEMRQTRPALLQHPVSNEKVWFNQAHLYDFNPKLLGLMGYIGTKILYYRDSRKLHDVTYGDGERVARKDLYHILDVLEKETVAYPWKQGDVMVLDNILTMHGRAPFKGPRRILTALTI